MKRTGRYTIADKVRILTKYLNSEDSMEAIQMKYGMGHCTLTRWMTTFGISNMPWEQICEMKISLETVPEKAQGE